jgi:hypothetical protein
MGRGSEIETRLIASGIWLPETYHMTEVRKQKK